jgi:hypothetical protein
MNVRVTPTHFGAICADFWASPRLLAVAAPAIANRVATLSQQRCALKVPRFANAIALKGKGEMITYWLTGRKVYTSVL